MVYTALRNAFAFVCVLLLAWIVACAPGGVRSLPLGGTVNLALLPTTGVDGEPLVRGTRATVWYFAGPECPIARSYSPVVARAAERDATRGITWIMVFPEEGITPKMVREFRRDYSLPLPALIEGSADLGCTLGVATIPSVAVVESNGILVYRGRIDNRYKGLGTTYGPPTRSDLDEVTNAIAVGTPVEPRSTTAVGCVLPPCGTAAR